MGLLNTSGCYKQCHVREYSVVMVLSADRIGG